MRLADCFSPLTPTTAKAIKDAGFDGVCRYLGGKTHPEWQKGMTPVEVSVHSSAGLVTVSNWESNPTHADYFTLAQARQDAEEAFIEARWIEQPLQTPIYFSVDYNAQPADFPRIAAYFTKIYKTIGNHYQIRAYAKAELLDYLHVNCHFLGPGWEPAAWDNGIVLERAALFQDKYGVALRGGIQVDEDVAKSTDVGWWTLKGVSNTLQQGASGDAVKTLQTQLNEVLGTHIAEDGQFGPGTAAAVKSFQQLNHLPVTGNVDGVTQSTLTAHVQVKQQQADSKTKQAHAQSVQKALDLLQQAQTLVKGL